MRKLGLIVKREYLTRVKTKGFVIGTLAVPLLGLAFCLLIIFLVNHKSENSLRIAVVDNSAGLGESIEQGLNGKLENGKPEFVIEQTVSHPADSEAVQKDLRDKINAGTLDAYLVIPADNAQSFELHMRNPDNFAQIGPLSGALDQSVITERLSQRGVHVDDLKSVLKGADLKLLKVSERGEAEEKGPKPRNRDRAGHSAVHRAADVRNHHNAFGDRRKNHAHDGGFDLRGAALRTARRENTGRGVRCVHAVCNLDDVDGAAFLVRCARRDGDGRKSVLSGIHVPPSLIAYASLFFFGGYFLYSTMFAAVGSACSNEQDAQQLQWLAMAPLVFCMIIYSVILNDPSSKMAVILSEIPFFAPVLMSLRISLQTPPFWQIALSFSLLVLTTIVMIWLSAKIYRVGVLMYGKRPSLIEMARWLRYS